MPRFIAAGQPIYGYVSHDYSKGIDTLQKWKKGRLSPRIGLAGPPSLWKLNRKLREMHPSEHPA